jgi:hypothetical protein
MVTNARPHGVKLGVSLTPLDRYVSKQKNRPQGRYLTFIAKDLEPILWFTMVYQRHVVGRGKFVKLSPTHYLISEIKICDEVFLQPTWMSELAQVFNVKPKPTNFQNRGLGSHLLQTMLNEAGRRGVRLVTARVEQNSSHHAKLIRWYEKRGFKIVATEIENQTYTRMCLELPIK